MWRILTEKASDSIWQEVGKSALKTAVETLIEEGIEASVEIWKKKRLKIQEEEIDDLKAQHQAGVQADGPEDRERKEYPGGDPEEADETDEVDETDETDETDDVEESEEDVESFEAFSSYVNRQV